MMQEQSRPATAISFDQARCSIFRAKEDSRRWYAYQLNEQDIAEQRMNAGGIPSTWRPVAPSDWILKDTITGIITLASDEEFVHNFILLLH